VGASLDIFDEIDKDKSGSITRSELEDKLSKDPELEKLLSMKKTIALMRDLKVGDTNGDGKISRDEFKKLAAKK
jgi:Ca2+-binding EF-hand superfamily protein